MFDQNQLYTALENAHNAGNADDARQIAEMIQQLEQGDKQRQGAVAQSVDQAQRLGGQAVRSVGSMFDIDYLKDKGNEIIAQQDKDIAEGGYVSPLGDMKFLEALDEGKGMQWVATRGAENAATIAAVPVATVGGVVATFLGAPIVGTGLAVGGTATGIGLGIGSVTDEAERKGLDVEDQSTAAKNVGLGVVVGVLDKIGASKLIPKSKLAGMTYGQVAEEIAKKSPSKAKAFLKNTIRAGTGEGLTEAAQTATEIGGVAAQGGEYTPDEVINQVVDNFVLGTSAGGTIGATTSAAKTTKDAITGDPQPVGDTEAASDLARDLEQAAEDNGFDLNNVDPSSIDGARATMDAVHKDYTSTINNLVNGLKDQLQIKKTDNTEQRELKTKANNAVSKAKNKTKNTVSQKDFEVVEKLVGDTEEGKRLIQTMRKTNEHTRVHNNGLKGGLSRLTDRLNPLASSEGYSNARGAANPIVGALSAGAAYGSGGATIPAQIGAVVGGRAVDAVTGRRSRVAKFIRDNAQNAGMDTPSGNSVVERRISDQQKAELAAVSDAERKKQEASNRRALNRELGASGAAPTPDSPQDIMQKSTGLDKGGVATIMRIIERTNQNPAITKAIQEYRISIDTGGKIGNEMLSPLIRAVNQIVESQQQFKNMRIAEPDRGEGGEQTEAQQRARQGKANNRKAVQELQDAVNNDPNIAIADKAVLNQALNDLSGSLGSRPIEAAFDIISEAEAKLRNKPLAEKYLLPYLTRINRQQRGKKDDGA